MQATNVVAAGVALVIGLVLGGVMPRAEIRELKDRIEELEERDCAGIGRDLSRMLSGRALDEARGGVRQGADHGDRMVAPDRKDAPPPRADNEPEDLQPDAFEDDVLVEDVDRSPMDVEENLETMREAFELRRAQARAALAEQTWASDDQMAQVDQALADMNADLESIALDLVGEVRDRGEPSRRDAMMLAADTLDVMIEAETRVRSVFGENQLESVDDETLNPFSYIDPGIVDVIQELDR